MLRVNLILFCWILSLGTSASSQTFHTFSEKTLSMDDGLSQGSNYFRYEDSLGYVWISANDAVNRYDGSQIKVFNLNNYFENCPNLAQAYGIVEDNKTNVYLGSTNGLYCYSRKKGVFNLIKIYSDKNDQVTMPFGFWDNKIWCFNNKYEIVNYDLTSKKTTFFAKLDLPELASVHVYNLTFSKAFYQCFPFLDKNNRAWFCSKNKVLAIDLNTKSIEYPLDQFSLKKELEINSSYFNEKNNEIQFATNQGIVHYATLSKKIKLQSSIANYSLENSNSVVTNKNIMAVFQPNRLTIFDIATNKILYQIKRNSAYYKFGFDKNNRLWFCDDGKGQTILDFNENLIHKADKTNTFSGVDFNGVASINSINGNELLINSNYIWNKSTKTVQKTGLALKKYYSFRSSPDELNKGIWLYNDASKNTFDALYFLDENKKVTKYLQNKDLSIYGIIQDIKSITKDSIILACEKGLFWFVISQNEIKPIASQTQTNAFYINKLSSKRLAISYINHDMLLARIDGKGNLLFEKKILPNKQSFYLQEDENMHQYWVGTNNGLYLLDKNFEVLKVFDANSGMAGTYIYGLLLDDVGNIWASHQRGLSSINTFTHQIINYDKNDGVQDWDFNNRSFCKTDDGTLYFGGTKGFNYFKPPLKFSSAYLPKVYLEELKINSKSRVELGNPDFVEHLKLSSQENNISLVASILDLQNASSYKIAYRLNNEKWILTKNYAKINFNSLSPKTYNFQLGIFDKFQNKIIVQKTLIITIEAPFYKTIWFWILVSIISSAILFGFLNRRTTNKQKRFIERQLELYNQRQAITADLHDDIGSSLSSLQLNSAIAERLIIKQPEKGIEYIEKIENQARSLASKIGDFIWSMKTEDELMTISSRIKNYASEMLGATSIKYTIAIEEEVLNKIKDFKTRKNIVLIVKEAINNSVKYSEAKNLGISLKRVKDSIAIQVEDDGLGFAENCKKGNGLLNMQHRTEELGGIFEIHTHPNKGTTICSTIPLPSFKDTKK